MCVCVRDKEREYSGGDVGSDKNMFHRFGHIARLCAYVCVFVYVTLTMRERKKGCVRERERERESIQVVTLGLTSTCSIISGTSCVCVHRRLKITGLFCKRAL